MTFDNSPYMLWGQHRCGRIIKCKAAAPGRKSRSAQRSVVRGEDPQGVDRWKDEWTEGSFKMTKVLIVEDSELLLRIMSDAFEAEGYQVVVAEDGEIALRRFIEEKPDLVVTDCLIPKMDGFKLVKNIREFEAPYRTPVVMTSAIYRKANYKQVALDAGADS